MTVLVYVVIIAAKLARLERETAELAELARKRKRRWLSSSSSRRCSPTARRPSPTPASSAAPASPAGSRPGASGSAGSPRPRCSSGRRPRPRASRGAPGPASLNLFVWLVVGAYLIWGCTPRYRLLGLAVMPVAAALLALAWAGGGTALEEGERSGAVLAVHVGADAGRLRGPDARRRDGRALSLAGAPPEAPRARRPQGARAAARRARPARRAHRARLARAADARDRRRRRQLRARRLRRRDGRHARRLGDLRVAARASPRGLARPAGGARSTWPASRSSPSSSP